MMRRQKGFGLIGIIVLIVGIGVIVAVAATIAIPIIQEGRPRATLHEMELLSEAIAPSHPGEGRGFGFIGDVGRFPTSLEELVENYNIPSLPLWSVITGIGWRPHIKRGFGEDPDAFRRDGWGNFYDFNPTTGVITSLGSDGEPDGAGFAADFSTEDLRGHRFGIIRGHVRDTIRNPLPGVEVSVREPVDGTPTWRTPVITGAAGFYSLSNVIVGRRRLRVISGGLTYYLYAAVTPHIVARVDFSVAVDFQ